MFCPECGAQIPEGGVCPNCNNAAPETVSAEKVKKGEKKTKLKRKKFGDISFGSKNYAAILSAVLVFPAALSVALDLSIHRDENYWFGYVVGALAVVWVCLVLPALKVFHPAVNTLISFAAVMAYVSFIMYKTGHLEWVYEKALPLFVLFAAFVAIDLLLISYRKTSWVKVLAVMSAETGIYLLAIEATFKHGFDNLRWSPVLCAIFVSGAAMLFAISYVVKNNKKAAEQRKAQQQQQYQYPPQNFGQQ